MWKAEIGRIMIPGQLRQKNEKIARPHLDRKKLGMVVHPCHPSNSGKYKTGGSQCRPVWWCYNIVYVLNVLNSLL
jgi:hypothetical protein